MRAQVLPAILVAALSLGGMSAQAAVINGSFEDTTETKPNPGKVNGNAIADLRETGGSGRDTWDVYDEIVGWTTADGAGIEIQTNATIGTLDAQEGTRYVELDSHSKSNSNSSMLSNAIALVTGRYKLSFYYSPRRPDKDTNGIDYAVLTAPAEEELVAGEVRGPNPAQDTEVGKWTEINAFFTLTSDENVVIRFSATGTKDSLGGLIDNVSISAVPLPAGVLLMLTALGGAGVAYRSRSSA